MRASRKTTRRRTPPRSTRNRTARQDRVDCERAKKCFEWNCRVVRREKRWDPVAKREDHHVRAESPERPHGQPSPWNPARIRRLQIFQENDQGRESQPREK